MFTVTPNDTEFLNVGTGTGTANVRIKNDIIGLTSIDLLYKIWDAAANGGNGAFVRATEAEMNTDILDIDFKVAGTSQRAITPAKIFSLERLKGQEITAGRVPIRFAQPERRSVLGEDYSLVFPHLNGEISIDAKLAANATARSLKAKLAGRKLTPKQYKEIKVQPNAVTYREEQIQVTTVGKKVHTVDMSHGRSLSMFHCFSTDITAVRVLLGDLILFDFEDKDELDAFMKDAGYTPQADMWSVGGELFSSRVGDALSPTNRTLKVEFEMAAANSFNVLFEELGRFKA